MNTTTTTTTATVDLNDVATVNDTLVKTATDKLTKSLDKDSLDDLVAATTRRSILLADVSGSMDEFIDDYNAAAGRKIDALRKVVADLRESHPVPVAAFGCYGGIRLIDTVPEPEGGTPMGAAIQFAKDQGANHAAMVTDGCPDSEQHALDAARAFGGPVDVFFVGALGDVRGKQFAQRLAKVTGGTCTVTTLGNAKALTTSLRGLLGDGTV